MFGHWFHLVIPEHSPLMSAVKLFGYNASWVRSLLDATYIERDSCLQVVIYLLLTLTQNHSSQLNNDRQFIIRPNHSIHKGGLKSSVDPNQKQQKAF